VVAFTLKMLAEQFSCQVKGNPDTVVDSVATLQDSRSGAISFLSNSKYKKFLSTTKASAVIIAEDVAADCPIDALVCSDPYTTYAKVAAAIVPNLPVNYGVHPNAVVSQTARIHASVSIGPNSFIADDVEIGENTTVGPNCVVDASSIIGRDCHFVANVSIGRGSIIGDRALIHPGVVIGADGFGLAMDQGRWIKVPQLGRVRLESDVEVGANTTIDRGAIDDTILHEGVKLDNQIQVAHNVEIGAHTAIAGCTAIAGSTQIGQYCTISGAVGIVGHLKITDKVHVTAMSLVTKSITKPGSYSSGTPLVETSLWRKLAVRFKQLDKLAKKIGK
jgi:UDP-3-O-[3-hydroxymyristoyl] glucosamine N-acyltransferase